MSALEVYSGNIDVDGISNATDMNMLFENSWIGGGTGVTNIDDLHLSNSATGDYMFYVRGLNNVLSNSTISGNAGTGSNLAFVMAAEINGTGGVFLDSNTITTASGEVILSGSNSTQIAGSAADLAYLRTTGYASSNSAYHQGIRIDNTDITSTDGDITVSGRGYAAGSDGYGVYIHNSSTLNSTGTGASAGIITLKGLGRDSNSSGNGYGVYLTGAGTAINSVDGAVDITGTGAYGGSGGANNYGIFMASGAKIASTGTGAAIGAITLNGTGGAGTTTNYGILLDGTGTSLSSVDGNIDLTGVGGNGSGASNSGIVMQNSATIASTGTTVDAATITLHGTAGTGVNGNMGIQISGANAAGVKEISSAYGDISLTGIAAGTGNGNRGIYLSAKADIESTGTGADAATITISGTGANGGSFNNHGIRVDDVGTLITAVDGAISLTGTGGNGSSSDNYGIFVEDQSDIISTGTGVDATTITLTGIAGNGTSNNFGVYLTGAGTSIASVAGNISIAGTGASGASSNTNHGVYLQTDADILTTGGADVTISGTKGAGTSNGIAITGATVTIGGGTATGDFTFITDDWSLANLAVQNSGTLTIKPYSEPTTIGVSGGAGGLNITDAELALFSGFSKLVIGDSVDAGGAVDIDSWALNGANYSAIRELEIYGGSIDADSITNGLNTSMIFGGSGLNASTGVVDIDALTLTNNDGVDRTFYARSAASTILSNSTLSATSGKLNAFVNADSDGLSNGAIRLTGTTVTTNGGELILSGGNSGQTWLSAADLTYLRDTGKAWGVTGEVEGVELGALTTITTNAGNVTLRGHGWDDAASASHRGVWFNTGGRPLITTTGSVTVDGTGGAGTDSNVGVTLQSIGDAIRTQTGTVNVTGRGGAGTTNFNDGIVITNLTNISSTGAASAGDITLTGIGGAGLGNSRGIYLPSGTINSVTGDIELIGTVAGPVTSTVNHGMGLA